MIEKEKLKEKMLRLVWDEGEDIPYVYANHIYVTHQGGSEFHIMFGHAAPPLLLGKEEDELPDSVAIKPVAKIVTSPDAARAFLEVLTENIEKYESTGRSDND